MKRLVGLLLMVSGCLVPSLAELEQQNLRHCNDSHPCAPNYLCIAELCRSNGSGTCTPGQTQQCGSNIGDCRLGTQTCGSDAKWGSCVGGANAVTEVCDGKDNDCDGMTDEDVFGAACPLSLGVCAGAKLRCVMGQLETACTAATYGADYESSETRCDSKDNDCDGQTDEGVVQACPKQLGVCAGLQVSCASGQFPACDMLYGALAKYEPIERSCDGIDNDCDGRVDQAGPQNLSLSAGVDSKRPSGALLADGGLLVLWEEGLRVVARRVSPTTGDLSPVVTPAESIKVVTAASVPVVVNSGGSTFAAWAEVGAVGLRVMLAPLDSNGESTILAPGDGGHLAQPIQMSVTDLKISAIALAVDPASARVFVGVIVDGRVNLYAFPTALPGSEFYRKLDVFGSTTASKIALAAGKLGDLFFTVQNAAPIEVRKCMVTGLGNLVRCAAPTSLAFDPQVATNTNGEATFVYVSTTQLLAQPCPIFPTDGGNCPPTLVTFANSTLLPTVNVNVEFGPNALPRFAAWNDRPFISASGMSLDAGVVRVSANSVGSVSPQAFGFGGVLRGIVVDNTPDGDAGTSEVLLHRLCAP